MSQVSNARRQARRAMWQKENRCKACGSPRDNPPHKLCAACLTYDRQYKAARKAQGLCLRCSDHASPGMAYCDACRAYMAQRQRDNVIQRREAPGPNLLAWGGGWIPITDPAMLLSLRQAREET